MSKSRLSTFSLYLFYLVSIVNLIEQIVNTGWLDMGSKPLLMPLLLIHFLSSMEDKSFSIIKMMLGALVFSWLGDVLLMFQGKFEGMFIYGLAAFLIAHVFYIFSYRLARFTEIQSQHKTFILTRVVFLAFIGATLVYMLHRSLGDLLLPVVLYTAVIITMSIYALLRRGWTQEKSFIMVYSGALLFIMSDAMIAIDKFTNPIVQARLLIMATYIAAQFLIVKGILAHYTSEPSLEEDAS